MLLALNNSEFVRKSGIAAVVQSVLGEAKKGAPPFQTLGIIVL